MLHRLVALVVGLLLAALTPGAPAAQAPARSAPAARPGAVAADSTRADSTRADSSRADSVRSSAAPVGPLRGVVWGPPASESAARADLRRVRAAGFRAVRTSVLSSALLADAERRGLSVYVDLPVDYATASDLAAARPALLRQIASLGRQARQHPALAHVGLARRADTRDPAVCRILHALAAAATAQRLTPYVVAAYGPEDAACAGVPLVLLDRTDAAPLGDLRDYGAAWPVEAGGVRLAYLVGEAVQADRYGVLTPGSAQRQARALAEAARSARAPVFVVQWRDGGDLGRDNPRLARYGLHTDADAPRLSARVLEEVLRGERTSFTYAGAPAPARPSRAPTVWLWLALLLTGAVMATEPRLRTILPRFVRSPSFFRDSVRDARGTMVGANLLHWIALCLFVGVFATTLLRAAAARPAFSAFLAMLPAPLGRGLAGVLDQPALAVMLVALLFAVLTGLWAYGFVLAARRRYQLSLWQAVMLIVWHRWLVVPLSVLALVFLRPDAPGAVVVGWALAFAAVELWGALRSAFDLVLMTRLPVWLGLLLFLVPVGLAFGVGVAWFRSEDLAFLARL